MRWYITGYHLSLVGSHFCGDRRRLPHVQHTAVKKMAEEQLSSLAANYESTLDTYKAQALALMLDNSIQEYLKGGGPDSPGYYERTDQRAGIADEFHQHERQHEFRLRGQLSVPGIPVQGKSDPDQYPIFQFL